MRSPNHYYYTPRRLFAKAFLFPQSNWGFLYAKAPMKKLPAIQMQGAFCLSVYFFIRTGRITADGYSRPP